MKKMKLSRLLAVLLAMMIAITPCIAGVAENATGSTPATGTGAATDTDSGTGDGAGADAGDKEEDKEPPAISITGVKVYALTSEAYVGDSVSFSATVEPSTSANQSVTWSVTHPATGSINATGSVKLDSHGSWTIRATSVADPTKYGEATIRVYDKVTNVSAKSSMSLEVGDTDSLNASVQPSNAKQGLAYTSKDTSVAVVGNDGTVTAKGVGTTTITITSTDDKNKTATCTVTVTAKKVPVNSVTLTPSSLSLEEGKTGTLKATVTPDNATNNAVTWSSSDATVAKVEDGKVTALKAGSTTITVTTADGNKTASITVTVTAKPVAVTGVALNQSTLSLKTGASATLTATITPSNATNTGIEWSSSNEDVATVSGGVVTALKAGTAIITVKTKDGAKTATCTVTVTDPVKVNNIALNFTSKTLEVGDTFQLKATVSPSTADDTSVTFESKDPSVATVKADGTVTAKAKGTTNIIVSATDGSNVTVFCSVTVNEKTIVPVTGITGVPSTLTIAPGAVYQLNPSVEPSNATEKGFTYASANTSKVTVDENGIITAVGADGQAYVYVYSKANPSVKATVKVIIGTPKPVQSIALNSNAATLWVDGTYQLTATVMPTDASVKEVTYSSDNTTVATVDNTGKITAKAKGTAKITVSAMDGSGKTATCTVTVKQPATGVVITPTSFTMAKGESKTLTAIISPTGADETGVNWTSSNPAVATVYNGVVYANADGVATITATCVNASNIKASCTVTVGTKVSSIGLAPATAAMKTGSTLYISSVVSPTNASNKSLIWKSNDTNKAIVNNGSVTAYAPGVVTITATAADGSGVTAQCVITITGEAIATPTPVPTPSPSPTIPPATKINCIANTTKGSLNVRDRASTAGNVIARIPQYGAFTVTAWGSTWCQVSYNGVTGYVMTQYVKKVEDPSVTPTPGPTMPAGQTAQVNTAKGSLNMRSKVDGPVIAKIPEKAYFIVLEYGATWCKAWYDGHEGYVMTKFLVLTGGSMSDTPTPTPSMEPVIDYGKVTTVSGGLNLRSNPDGTKLAVIPQNATVAVHIKDTTWCRVTYGGKTGYVMTKFLTFGASAPTETPEVPEGTVTSYARVTTVSGGLNLRQTVNGTRIAVIPQNAVIGVITKGADWSYVKYGTKVGYVMTKFLTDTTETPSETPTTPSDTVVGYGKVTTITGSLNMRSGAGKNYGVIAQIKQGGVVEVLDKGTTWSRVRYGGKTGYVMSSYLTFSTSRPAEDTTPEVSTGTKAQVTTVTGTLNMRSGMGTNYALKAKIPQKAYVQVLTYGPTWSYVSYNGTTGYVMTQYLTIVE